MTTLTSTQIDEIWANVMSAYSAQRTEIPITKTQLRSGIVLIDGELETAELAVLSTIPTGEIRTWLLNNQHIARDIMERTERKRKDVL